MDVLAANHRARALYTDFEALPARSRNMARLVFLDDHFRSLYVDWEDAARGIVASPRLYAGRHPHDPALAELVGELSVQDADFRHWWADHDVFRRTHGTKRFHHPVVGDLVLGVCWVLWAWPRGWRSEVWQPPFQVADVVSAMRGRVVCLTKLTFGDGVCAVPVMFPVGGG
jgi:hypothetical protein